MSSKDETRAVDGTAVRLPDPMGSTTIALWVVLSTLKSPGLPEMAKMSFGCMVEKYLREAFRTTFIHSGLLGFPTFHPLYSTGDPGAAPSGLGQPECGRQIPSPSLRQTADFNPLEIINQGQPKAKSYRAT